MSYVRCAGAPVLEGDVDLGLRGVWVAELTLDADEAPAEGQRVTIEVGDLAAYEGTVRTAGAWQGRVRVFVVGGAGGLGRAVRAQHYANGVSAAQLVDDLLLDAGEALSAKVDRAALEALWSSTWERIESGGAVALGRIADAHGLAWRVLADGSVWLGAEAWPAYRGTDPLELERDDARGRAVLADAEMLAPGVELAGRPVYRVVHSVRGDEVRATVTYERSDRGHVEQAVRALLPELPYLRTYEARVVGQNADNTLEIIAYDPKIGGLSRVPIRLGIPGARVQVSFGARVDVGFEDADPRRAYAGLWNTDAALQTLRIAIDGALSPSPVARRGDHTTTGALSISLVPFPPPPAPPTNQLFTIAYVDADGTPGIFTMLLDVATVQVLPAPATPLVAQLVGLITEGSAGVSSS